MYLEMLRFAERADRLPQMFKRSVGPERHAGRGHLEKLKLCLSCDKREMSAAAPSTTIKPDMPLATNTGQP